MGAPSTKRAAKVSGGLINWFEIPVYDLQRATAFYNQIFGIEMEVIELADYAMALFPEKNGMGGALMMGQGCVPSETGALLYLNASPDLQGPLGRVEEAGGRVVLEKTHINDHNGFFALFIDTEGNKLALNSKQ
jgi:uncharacterized protein